MKSPAVYNVMRQRREGGLLLILEVEKALNHTLHITICQDRGQPRRNLNGGAATMMFLFLHCPRLPYLQWLDTRDLDRICGAVRRIRPLLGTEHGGPPPVSVGDKEL